jgi:hypothetical protein
VFHKIACIRVDYSFHQAQINQKVLSPNILLASHTSEHFLPAVSICFWILPIAGLLKLTSVMHTGNEQGSVFLFHNTIYVLNGDACRSKQKYRVGDGQNQRTDRMIDVVF